MGKPVDILSEEDREVLIKEIRKLRQQVSEAEELADYWMVAYGREFDLRIKIGIESDKGFNSI